MPKRAPTNAELEILRVLWQRGPSTVRDVHESLDDARPVGYTTVLKLLQIMVEKRLVRRAFGGSTPGLLLPALESTPPPGPELGHIPALLDEKNGGRI